ncbi:hypothetical protein H4R18_001843 [Coemansia javaensis]|uniref:Uncharacterized protein n=1 Tax=Coemansia javaensis TaxID=2761396 RepID=A0A9W8HJD0_9FUNG|nr:hypothetical protein H4R18_001843 [Coemansia javaensis]
MSSTVPTAPPPPPTPGVPVERHPYNDDWATTLVAILLMSLIVFVALGILVRRSFRLVPTGVMALRTLVGAGAPAEGHHRLEEEEEASGEQSPDATRLAIPESDDDDDDRHAAPSAEPPGPPPAADRCT